MNKKQLTQKQLDKMRIVLYGGEGSGNFGHAGRPGEVGGSSGTGKSDWQGRPLKERDVLRGGNLTQEEVAVFDMAFKHSPPRFRGKDANSEALQSLKEHGLIRAMPKLAKSYDQYYEFTSKGLQVREQLYLVRKRKEKGL